MELKDLEVFAAVLDTGSFSAASRQLYLSQPTVSVHIKSLESEFGVKLIDRTTRSVKATTAGKRLYLYAREMLRVEESIITDELLHGITANIDADASAEGFSGAIRIAASVIPAHYVLPSPMAIFQKKNPDVRFHIITGDNARTLRLVRTQQVDFGLLSSMVPHFDCEYTEIGEDELVVITPNTAPFQDLCRGGFPMEELFSFPFIAREEESGTRKASYRFLKNHGFDPKFLNITMQMEDAELIKQSVAQGLGISILSRRSIGDFEHFGMILASPFREGRLTRPIFLASHTQTAFSPQTDAFVQFLKSERPHRGTSRK